MVELAIEPGIGAEGFKIADGTGGTVRIIGNDDRGLLYGVGKFCTPPLTAARGSRPARGAESPCRRCPFGEFTSRPTSTTTTRSPRSRR